MNIKLGIVKSIFRLGACYGLWMTGDLMLQTVGIFFAIAEVIDLYPHLEG